MSDTEVKTPTQQSTEIYAEWLDSNKYKAYPFRDYSDNVGDQTGAGAIPPMLFVDAFFMITCDPEVSDIIVRIDKLVQGMTSFQAYIEVLGTSSEVDPVIIADIPYDTAPRSTWPISWTDGVVSVSGGLIVGDLTEVRNLAAVHYLGDFGIIFPGCVRKTPTAVIGISVGNTVYTGNVTLEGGDGIDITVLDANGDPVEEGAVVSDARIRITANNRVASDEAYTNIKTDKDIVDAIFAKLGNYVRTINGVSPDSEGGIWLATPDGLSSATVDINEVDGTGSADGEPKKLPLLSAFPGGDGSGVIHLADATGTVVDCADYVIETITGNISELNDRGARILESINALDTANNVISMSLSRLH